LNEVVYDDGYYIVPKIYSSENRRRCSKNKTINGDICLLISGYLLFILCIICMPYLRPDGRLEVVDEKILFPDFLEDQV
jgi:hypothetical protein